MDNYEILCGITLNRIFGYEPACASRLLERFGSPGAVFSLSKSELDEAFGPWSKFRASINDSELEVSRRELQALSGLGCTFILKGSPGYPPLLGECEDAPVGLYIRSRTPPEELWGRPAVSVVGTRDLSPYGKEWTEKIVRTLSLTPGKPLIVSGFAIGVDITAHLAALAFGLPTVAVLPVGIDDIYPRRHRTALIAGISQATILSESKAQGGGTMTARLASGYGREVYCLPGRIDDLRSAGCNRLIAEKLAEPIADIDALGAQMGLGASRRVKSASLEDKLRDAYAESPEGVREGVIRIALHIREHRGITPDEICRDLGLPAGEVSAAVCLLESDGFVYTDLLRRCCIDNKKV